MFPKAPELALDLLEKMLTFAPDKRIPVDNYLASRIGTISTSYIFPYPVHLMHSRRCHSHLFVNSMIRIGRVIISGSDATGADFSFDILLRRNGSGYRCFGASNVAFSWSRLCKRSIESHLFHLTRKHDSSTTLYGLSLRHTGSSARYSPQRLLASIIQYTESGVPAVRNEPCGPSSRI